MKQDGRHKLLDIQYIMHSLQIYTFTSDFTTMSRIYRALPLKRTQTLPLKRAHPFFYGIAQTLFTSFRTRLWRQKKGKNLGKKVVIYDLRKLSSGWKRAGFCPDGFCAGIDLDRIQHINWMIPNRNRHSSHFVLGQLTSHFVRQLTSYTSHIISQVVWTICRIGSLPLNPDWILFWSRCRPVMLLS